MKTVEVRLGYFKSGDDLRSCSDCVAELGGHAAIAIMRLANQLECVVGRLDDIYDIVRDEEIEIEADTHYISITCEDEIAQKLVDEGLAYFPEYENDE